MNRHNPLRLDESAQNPRVITVCCGLTLREPIERWLGPIRAGWPGTPPRLRLLTIPMLEQEPPRGEGEDEAGSALLAVMPEDEPFHQTLRIVEHARRTSRPALLLCERVEERHRSIVDEGILVEPWDTDPADVVAMLATLDRRQPTVTKLTRELDVVERLLTEVQVPGEAGEELQLAGLMPDVLIPRTPPRIQGLDLGIAHRAAGAISRDLVDVALIDEATVRIFAADGLNRGTAGALLAMRLVRAVHGLGKRGDLFKVFHPGAALAELNQEVCEVGSHGMPHRASALYAVIDLHKGELTVASAGFPSPMIVGPKSVRRIGPVSTALGLSDGVEYGETNARLGAGELLVIASDGAEEAFRRAPGFDLCDEARGVREREGDLLGESRRLEDLFDALPGSLHRDNDCTVLTARIGDALRRDRWAA